MMHAGQSVMTSWLLLDECEADKCITVCVQSITCTMYTSPQRDPTTNSLADSWQGRV